MTKTNKPNPVAAKSSVSHQLREIIERDGRSVYELELEAGIPRGGLARFVAGERGLTTSTLDRLSTVIGLRLVEVEVKRGKRRPRPAPGPGPIPTAGHPAEPSPDTSGRHPESASMPGGAHFLDECK